MQHSAEMLRCLLDCDVEQMRKLDQHLMPHLSRLSDAQVLVTIHLARTATNTVPLKLRAWSHRWLLDNGYPSKLPDHLKPLAERIYPRIVEGVGIAVKAGSDLMRPITGMVRDAMADAVLDIYADQPSPDPALVRQRMQEARNKIVKKLIGK